MIPPYTLQYGNIGILIEEVAEIAVGEVAGPYAVNEFDSLGVGIAAFKSNLEVRNNHFGWIFSAGYVKGGPANSAAQSCAVYAEGKAVGYTPDTVFTLKVGGDEAARNVFTKSTLGVRAQKNMRLECLMNTFIDIPYVGVLLQECHGDSSFVERNHFSNCWIGVRGDFNYHAQVNVANDTMVSDASHPGVGIWLDDLNFFGQSTPGGYLVSENYVDLYGFGIGVSGGNHVVIDENEVHLRGIHPSYGNGAGIYTGGCDSAFVTQNEVRGYGPLTDEIDGILISNSPEVQVKCNEIYNFRNDLRFRFPSVAANVRKNVFNAGLRGIVFQDSANIGNQGSLGDPVGNLWNSGVPGQGWACGGNGGFMTLPVNSPFNNELMYVRNTQFENPEHASNPLCFNPNLSGYHQTTTGADPTQCGPISNSGGGPGSNRVSSLKEIANESAAAQGNPGELLYQKEQFALAILKGDSNLCQNDSLLQSCHDELNIGNRLEIHKMQEKLAGGKPAEAMDFNKYSPKNDVEYNFQFVTKTIAKWDKESLIESADSTVLEAISAQCPLFGGRPVYQARTLLGLVDPGRIIVNHGCLMSSSKEAASSPEDAGVSPAVSFFPNPTSKLISVKTPHSGKVAMHNMNGVVVGEWEIIPGLNSLRMPEVARGVYLFRYILENGTAGSARIVLQ
jgi:hypothetical protein